MEVREEEFLKGGGPARQVFGAKRTRVTGRTTEGTLAVLASNAPLGVPRRRMTERQGSDREWPVSSSETSWLSFRR